MPKKHITTTIHAAAISRILRRDDFHRYQPNNDSRGGYLCSEWGTDEGGNIRVRVDYFGVNRDIGSADPNPKVVQKHRSGYLTQIQDALRVRGYTVSWGWDEETMAEDRTFIVVHPSVDVEEEPEGEPSEEEVEEEYEYVDYSHLLILPLEQAEQVVKDIANVYRSGKDEAARRMEAQLYRAVLISIVSGSEETIDLAAVALETQKLFFPR